MKRKIKEKGKSRFYVVFLFLLENLFGKTERKIKKNCGFLKKKAGAAIVNLVQKRKMKISTIDESKKFGEKSLQCDNERVKILT